MIEMTTRVVTTHLPTDLAERLDGLAERLDRPKGWVVKEAIASYVALEEKRHRLTLEALADVDAGRMLEHAEVEAWAAGLDKPKRARHR
jgi:predicted transcriptional regulator